MAKDAQRTQEVDKTPTPPPQEGKDAPKPAPTATGASSGGASDSGDSQKSGGGLTSFFEGLKSNFGQSSQSKSEDKGSTPEASPTALEGNPSPPPSLTAGIEAETDQNSKKPAVQALIEGISLHEFVLMRTQLSFLREGGCGGCAADFKALETPAGLKGILDSRSSARQNRKRPRADPP